MKYIMKFFQPKRGRRPNLVLVAIQNFPGGFFKTSVGITLLAGPFLLNYFSEMGVNSIVERVLLNGMVIVIVPATLLFIVTLFRSPNLRRLKEVKTANELKAATDGIKAIKVQELKEEKEIVRLEQIVIHDRNVRRDKDEMEEKRWGSLNERLRVQEETGQHNIDLREERDIARRELASEERLLVAQQVKENKEEGEVMRKGLVSDDLEARHAKERREEKRWEALYEQLRVQEERSEAREQRQLLREEEQLRMRREDEIKNQYKVLLERYVRNSTLTGTLRQQVLDGHAPIADEWLEQQPEIRKNPALLQQLAPLNKR